MRSPLFWLLNSHFNCPIPIPIKFYLVQCKSHHIAWIFRISDLLAVFYFGLLWRSGSARAASNRSHRLLGAHPALEASLLTWGSLTRGPQLSFSPISTRRPITSRFSRPLRVSSSFPSIRTPPSCTASTDSGRPPSAPRSSQDGHRSVSFVLCSVEF